MRPRSCSSRQLAAASRVAWATASASGTAYSGWFAGYEPSSAERRVAAMYRFGSASCGAVGASVENARSAPASRNSVHAKPRSARSSPSIAAQFAQIAGSACTGCIDAVTPSAAMRPAVSGAAYSRCSMRWRRGRSPFTACACSSASSATSLARSPIACIATCRPAASAAATTGCSRSSGQIGSAFEPSAYGCRIAAVHASITPSSTSLMPATLSHGRCSPASSTARATWARFCVVVAGVRDEPVREHPDRQRAAAALGGAVERREAELVERHVDHARDARREVGRDRALDGGVAVGVGGDLGEQRPHVLLRGGLVEHAVGLAVGVASDAPADGIGGVPVDAELAQRGRVDPDRVVVVRVEVHGHVGDDGVEHRRGRARRRARSRTATRARAGAARRGRRHAPRAVDPGSRAGCARR